MSMYDTWLQEIRGTPWSSGREAGQLWRVMRNPRVKTMTRDSVPARNRQTTRRRLSPRGIIRVTTHSSRNTTKHNTSTVVRSGTATSPNKNFPTRAQPSRLFKRQKGLCCSSSSAMFEAGYMGLKVGTGARGLPSENVLAGSMRQMMQLQKVVVCLMLQPEHEGL